MKTVFALFCLVIVSLDLHAADRWAFNDRLVVAATSEQVFHHLDGAGRKHIAVTDDMVAVVWEDNRSSNPQVYVALKKIEDPEFTASVKLSHGIEAYEPAIAPQADGRFAVAWEQDSAVYVTLLDSSGVVMEPPIKLSGAVAGHVSLATWENQLVVVWRQQEREKWLLRVAEIELIDGQLKVISRETVEPNALDTPILFPSIAIGPEGICVAWEDRRSGHTRLLFSHAQNVASGFTQPLYLNEFQSNRNIYDRGSGVTRVSIHHFGEDEVLAAWMDKRRSNSGYGIYASLGEGSGNAFGPNERVHGKPGDKAPHYNPSTAGNTAGDFVVAWDDFRSGNSDIWLSTYNDDAEWGEDTSPLVASGATEQTHPSIALDEQGGVHLLWIERADLSAPTSLWYSYAPLNE